MSELFCPSGYEVVTRSEIGGRPSQQDRVFIRGEDTRLFAALCDGMGGTELGGMASQRAICVLQDMLSVKETYDLAFQRPVEFLQLALVGSDRTVSNDVGLHGSGTTLTTMLLDGNRAYWASVGDSRLYILRGSEMIQATRDHNYRLYLDELRAQELIGQKRYEDEIVRGRALISYIGIGKIRLLDLAQRPLLARSGDLFLLTSDGLTGLLPDVEIQRVLLSDNPLEQRADLLMQKALAMGRERSMDNTTFVLIQIM